MSAARTTAIEWTQHTWNPFIGCSIYTSGCRDCYAMKQAARIVRMGTAPAYNGTVRVVNGHPVWTGQLNRSSKAAFERPLHIREPSLIFVNSMSDFFHEAAPDSWRVDALDIMLETQRHQYQVLTKRPEQILPFLERIRLQRFPANVWIGATVEEERFVKRIDLLRAVPARVKFISAEPLLGHLGDLNLRGIHWLIAGGESGPTARPMHADWARSLRNQCVANGVKFFFKQWGEWIPRNIWALTAPGRFKRDKALAATMVRSGVGDSASYTEMVRVGKRAAGRMLDGVHWNEMPE